GVRWGWCRGEDGAGLEAEEGLARAARAEVRGDELGVADREHELPAARADPRAKPLAAVGGGRARHLAARRTDLEEVPRGTGGHRAAREHEPAQIRPPAA